MASASAAAFIACGARTGLVAPEEIEADASRDATRDVHDAAMEVTDVTDAPVIPDVASGCDGGVTAYLWDVGGALYTFDPGTLATVRLGHVTCPTNATPWTFSVSRAGYALMIYEDWNIYRVDLSTLACTTTAYVSGQLGISSSQAIAISRDPMTSEKFYMYGLSSGRTILTVADPTALVFSEVGPVNGMPQLFPADMQGNANGQLFVLSEMGHLLEVDSATGSVLVDIQTSFNAGDWAVMTYGSQVFFFGDGNVSLADVATNTLTPLGSTGVSVVGASAAPCVP